MDEIKVYDRIPREAYFALAEEAERFGLAVVGHRPHAVSAAEMAEADQKSVDHARVFLHEAWPGAAALRQSAPGDWREDRIQMLAEHDSAMAQEIFAAFAEHGTWYVPTHLTRWSDAYADDARVREDPLLEYLHPLMRWQWLEDVDATVANDPSPQARETYRAFYRKGLELTGAAHRAGVPILAGTDYVVAGADVHRELGHLVDAGLSPAEALRAATLDPALYAEREADYGTVEAGKVADLVLLDADPLADIAHTQRIRAVVFGATSTTARRSTRSSPSCVDGRGVGPWAPRSSGGSSRARRTTEPLSSPTHAQEDRTRPPSAHRHRGVTRRLARLAGGSRIRPPGPRRDASRRPPYVAQTPPQTRGRILAVVTSADRFAGSDEPTGYELTELSRAYYVFAANGFEVDVASPQGGEPPAVLDDDDMGAFDYAFMNDPEAWAKVEASLPLADVDMADYDAVYFIGGKGAMFDLPDEPAVQVVARDAFESGKVIAAVCHGPAALVGVTLSDGTPLLAGRTVAGFTNEEELFLIPDAREVFPFLLEDALAQSGAEVSTGPTYLEHVVHDGTLITGQNPWSVWAMAESVVEALGHTPVPRKVTPEENAVTVLLRYEAEGEDRARAHLTSLVTEDAASVDRHLLATHAFVAARQGRWGKAADLVGLLRAAKGAA